MYFCSNRDRMFPALMKNRHSYLSSSLKEHLERSLHALMLRLRRLVGGGSRALLRLLVDARLSASKQTLGDAWTFCCWFWGCCWFWTLGGVDDGVTAAGVLRSGNASYSHPRAPMSRRGSAEAFEPRSGSRGLRWWNREKTEHLESSIRQACSFLSAPHFSLESSLSFLRPREGTLTP